MPYWHRWVRLCASPVSRRYSRFPKEARNSSAASTVGLWRVDCSPPEPGFPQDTDYLDVGVTVCEHMSHAPGLTCLSSAAPKHDKGFHYKCLSGVAVARPGSFYIIILFYCIRCEKQSLLQLSLIALRGLCDTNSDQLMIVTPPLQDCICSLTMTSLSFCSQWSTFFLCVFVISNKVWSKFTSFKRWEGKADLVQSATGFGKTSIF